jgi:hypothetical protein
MRIETVSGAFGIDRHDVLILNKQELDTLRAAGAIMRRARDAATNHVGPDFIDSDTDFMMATGEHAFADILDPTDYPGRFDLGEI